MCTWMRVLLLQMPTISRWKLDFQLSLKMALYQVQVSKIIQNNLNKDLSLTKHQYQFGMFQYKQGIYHMANNPRHTLDWQAVFHSKDGWFIRMHPLPRYGGVYWACLLSLCSCIAIAQACLKPYPLCALKTDFLSEKPFLL